MKTYFNLPQFDNGEKATETVYSDRLIWDRKKYDELCRKHFGDESHYWSGRSPEEIELFLTEYAGKKIKLCKVEKLENKSNGYPYWRFDFNYAN